MWNIKENILSPSEELRKQKQNRQLELMLGSVIERLLRHSPPDIAEKAGAAFDEKTGCLRFLSLGFPITVKTPEYKIDRELGMWHHLTLLQYLDTADGTEPGSFEEMISLSDMTGGLARGNGFNKDIGTMFARWFGDVSPKAFEEACKKLGGEVISGRGDASVILRYAPRFPVMVNFWCSDDEFPASGKVLVAKNAEHYLTIEGAGGACSTVVQAIRDALER